MDDVLPSSRTETSDMLRLHQVFRDAVATAPQLIGTVEAGDAQRAALVGSYYDNVLRLLRTHHEGEDELVWPKLLARCPAKSELVSRVAAQHADVVPLADQAATQVEMWAASADAQEGEALVEALGRLSEGLAEHLDDEEALVLPLCAEYMSPAEWGELPAHGMRHFDGDKPWLVLGLIWEQMTAPQRSRMFAAMPPPAVQMWATMGRAAFEGFVAELRGPVEA